MPGKYKRASPAPNFETIEGKHVYKAPPTEMVNNMTYHDRAQQFIKGSRARGYDVSREGEELIAKPMPMSSANAEVAQHLKNFTSNGVGVGGVLPTKSIQQFEQGKR